MKKMIGFFTGARSDYGIMKNLISEIQNSLFFDHRIYVSGIHLLKQFGNTIEEIEKDNFGPLLTIDAFEEGQAPGQKEFSKIIILLCAQLKRNPSDVMFLLGDRLETYAAALACHFCEIPIIHLGGGTITQGAYDNIYRYNISNLATYHFATSKGNYHRLLKLPTNSVEETFFTGSFAIDAIYRFKKNPVSVEEIIPGLKKGNFCLLTFHSVTQTKENVAQIMDEVINEILLQNKQVLITYPNNDPGYREILKVIDKWKSVRGVFVKEHLGAQGYYSALRDCLLVIGNSSSGIIEAPYFNKIVINIGTRQQGREADSSVMTVPCNSKAVISVLKEQLNKKVVEVMCNEIYGNGKAMDKIKDILAYNILPKI